MHWHEAVALLVLAALGFALGVGIMLRLEKALDAMAEQATKPLDESEP